MTVREYMEALERRSWIGHGNGVVSNAPATIKARYWVSDWTNFGRIHIATGRGVRRTIRHGAHQRHSLIVEFFCPATLSRPRAIPTVEAAPMFTLCPRCVRGSQETR